MPQLTNIRTVSVPSIGKLSLAANPGTFTPAGVQRSHKPGRLAEDGGHTEVTAPAMLEININLAPGVDVAALGAVEGEDVTVRLSDGHVWLLPQAFVADPVSFADGEARVKIIANTSEQVS